ncbi:hypothetical protein [Peribacillus asahii]|uniref:hypothetical protein n=1 Tax=Peribacillus asahii TaxID=228899 RepID=UPI00207A0894|nr:hypothetical protein [Peribacillus asahii]USK71774.1 hypothetical protein LIS76_08475 [Peribacillus asahii]
MAYLKKALKWLSPGVEPSEEKKAQGFGNGEYPAAGHFDRMFNATYEAIEELQQKAGEVKTVNNQPPDTNGNVNINVDTSNLATKEELQAETQARNEHQADYLQHTGWAVATGTANAYIATLTPALSAYQEGVSLRLKINVDNTGASTINVNGLGAKAIKKVDGTDINVGQLKAEGIYDFYYNGTNFQLRSGGSELSDTGIANMISDINAIIQS